MSRLIRVAQAGDNVEGGFAMLFGSNRFSFALREICSSRINPPCGNWRSAIIEKRKRIAQRFIRKLVIAAGHCDTCPGVPRQRAHLNVPTSISRFEECFRFYLRTFDVARLQPSVCESTPGNDSPIPVHEKF